MDDTLPPVSRYLLEEVGAIWDASPTTAGPDGAARLAARINSLFTIDLTADDLLGKRSVAEVCAVVQAALVGPPPASGEPAATAAADHPLSSAQQRIWFVQQLADDAVPYNVPVRLELAGPVDEDALRGALADVWAAYEILRTTYPVTAGIPLARVGAPDAPPPLPSIDLSAEADPAAALDSLATQQAAIPFRLEQEPPVRLVLARRGRSRLVLVATFHHIAVDWVTVNKLVRDLGDRYSARVRGDVAASGGAPRAYGDVARWESSPDGSAAMDRAVAARAAALAGVPPVRLPTDRPRPRLARFVGAAVHDRLEPAAVGAVRRLAGRCRVTPFAILMAAFVVVLGRAGRQPEFTVATPASGRVHARWQETVGCFVNVVPVVVRPAAAATGTALVAQVSEATWEALDAQDAPFDRLVRASGQVAPVLFSYQPNSPLVAFHGLADTAPEFSSPPGSAKYDLSLYAIGRGPGMRLELEYDTDVYERETAAAVLDAYTEALHALVRDPDALVDLSAPSGFEGAIRRSRQRAGGLDQAAS
ncbi:condensation domain-containing protein [Micromonospora sp. NPDC049175]|uniref:condensation domain-containing protein n=1 Tax=Micromonospora sp. NPDC049175 TaxID=3364266 RepID=UPI0037204A04